MIVRLAGKKKPGRTRGVLNTGKYGPGCQVTLVQMGHGTGERIVRCDCIFRILARYCPEGFVLLFLDGDSLFDFFWSSRETAV